MEIVSNNIKKCVINTINDASIEAMTSNALFNCKALCWTNGILFSFEPYLMMDWTAKEAAAGNIYYFSLTKSKMEKYVPELADGSNNKIPVLNLDHHSFWKEVLEKIQ